MKRKLSRNSGALLLMMLALFTSPLACAAQQGLTERSFHTSKTQIEEALGRVGGGSGGRLPTVAGFIEQKTSIPVDRYSQPVYQQQVIVTSSGPQETKVLVKTIITAWYSAPTPEESRYEVLASNGRLESDFLDRLATALSTGNAAPSAPPSTKDAAESVLPDAPSASKSNYLSRLFKSRAQARTDEASTHSSGSSESKAQHLSRELQALENVRKQQVRPSDLAVVKGTKTPVHVQASEQSPVLLLAETDDEFQVLEAHGEWIHVSLMGTKRGWIRAHQLELPKNMPTSASTSADPAPKPAKKVREEVGMFPGQWAPLNGKKVKIVWVQPDEGTDSTMAKNGLTYVQSIFRKQLAQLPTGSTDISGVVVVLDSAHGGLVATTLSSLRRWGSGELATAGFWKSCWFDPPEMSPLAKN